MRHLTMSALINMQFLISNYYIYKDFYNFTVVKTQHETCPINRFLSVQYSIKYRHNTVQ